MKGDAISRIAPAPAHMPRNDTATVFHSSRSLRASIMLPICTISKAMNDVANGTILLSSKRVVGTPLQNKARKITEQMNIMLTRARVFIARIFAAA